MKTFDLPRRLFYYLNTHRLVTSKIYDLLIETEAAHLYPVHTLPHSASFHMIFQLLLRALGAKSYLLLFKQMREQVFHTHTHTDTHTHTITKPMSSST